MARKPRKSVSIYVIPIVLCLTSFVLLPFALASIQSRGISLDVRY